MRIRPPRTIVDAMFLLVLGGLCFVLFVFLHPPIKQSRQEARTWMAFIRVRALAADYQKGRLQPAEPISENSFVIVPDSDHEWEKTDPWGQRYRLIVLPGGESRVLSCGPNMATGGDKMDNDDIYSDMPVSPMKPFQQRRRRDLLVAIVVPLCCWVLGAAIYFFRW